MYHQVSPAESEGRSFFDLAAAGWRAHYGRSRSFKRRLQLFGGWVASAVPAGSSLLDCGCGSGVISLALAAKGYRVTGLDSSPGMIAAAREAAILMAGLPVDFVLGDVADTGLPDAAFDAVICSSVLEYLEEPVAAMREMSRVLRYHGRALVSVPNSASILRKLERMLHALGLLGTLHALAGRDRQGADYLRFQRAPFTELAVREMMTAAGFGRILIRYDVLPVLGRLGGLEGRPAFATMILASAQKESCGDLRTWAGEA